MKKLINLEGIKESLANLERIAREHPNLIDHNQCQWTAGDIQPMIDDKNIYSITEAAKLLQCHVETLRRAIRNKRLKAARVGRQYKISKSDLQEYYTLQGGGELF
jgi:excisionase family DNA binding protein